MAGADPVRLAVGKGWGIPAANVFDQRFVSLNPAPAGIFFARMKKPRMCGAR